MKAIKKLYIISLVLLAGISSFAEFKGPGSTQSATVVTVADAKQLMDDSWICLEGNIIKQLGGKYYQFQDR